MYVCVCVCVCVNKYMDGRMDTFATANLVVVVWSNGADDPMHACLL